MKKLYPLLIFALFFSALRGSAQNNFAPVGAEWWYHGDFDDFNIYNPSWSSKWADHIVVLSDTLINDTVCRQLVRTRYQKDKNNIDSLYIATVDTQFLYSTSDTVFYYHQQDHHFTPLYFFNVEEQDSFWIKAPFETWANYDSFMVFIDSIRLELYDTVMLKSYYTRTPNLTNASAWNWGKLVYDNDGNPVSLGKYTERIGGNWGKVGGILPGISSHSDAGTYNLHACGQLACYSDNSVGVFLSDISCDSVPNARELALDDAAINNHIISVFPNPSYGQFTIRFQNFLKGKMNVSLLNTSGQVMKQYNMAAGSNSLTISEPQLPSGMYILLFLIDNDLFYKKIVIR